MEFNLFNNASSAVLKNGMVYMPYNPDAKVTASTEGYKNCPDVPAPIAPEGCGGCNNGSRLQTMTVDNEYGGKMYIVYFNALGWMSESTITQFISLMESLDKSKDTLFIHTPEEMYLDDVEFVRSAILVNKPLETIMTATFIMDCNVAYLLTAANKVLTSTLSFIRIGLPETMAHGKVVDADNALRCNKYRILHMLHTLQDYKFIKTEEDFLHIVKKQGTIALFGDALKEPIDYINTHNTIHH